MDTVEIPTEAIGETSKVNEAGSENRVNQESKKVVVPGRTQAIIGIVCAVISLLLLPPVFGIAGIVLGSIAIKKGRTALGITTVALAAVCMIIGAIFGAYVSIQASHALEQQQVQRGQ